MSVGQKLVMLKIRSTSVTFLSLCNLEAAPEEAMQFRRLIKRSNESLGSYLFGKFEFWNFQGPRAEIPRRSLRRRQYLEKPASNRVNIPYKQKLRVCTYFSQAKFFKEKGNGTFKQHTAVASQPCVSTSIVKIFMIPERFSPCTISAIPYAFSDSLDVEC